MVFSVDCTLCDRVVFVFVNDVGEEVCYSSIIVKVKNPILSKLF